VNTTTLKRLSISVAALAGALTLAWLPFVRPITARLHAARAEFNAQQSMIRQYELVGDQLPEDTADAIAQLRARAADIDRSYAPSSDESSIYALITSLGEHAGVTVKELNLSKAESRTRTGGPQANLPKTRTIKYEIIAEGTLARLVAFMDAIEHDGGLTSITSCTISVEDPGEDEPILRARILTSHSSLVHPVLEGDDP